MAGHALFPFANRVEGLVATRGAPFQPEMLRVRPARSEPTGRPSPFPRLSDGSDVMKSSFHGTVVCLLLMTAAAAAETLPLPGNVVDFRSADGQRDLEESKFWSSGYGRISAVFETQKNSILLRGGEHGDGAQRAGRAGPGHRALQPLRGLYPGQYSQRKDRRDPPPRQDPDARHDARPARGDREPLSGRRPSPSRRGGNRRNISKHSRQNARVRRRPR